MASIYELLGVLVVSFALNLIPFASPSNLFIASNAALLVESDPFTLGFLVAAGSACAKGIHYIITFFVSKHLSEKRRQRLDAEAMKIKRWAFLLLFVAAATPIPDEPVVIPLGLLKYNPAKFFVAFFLGKLSITIFGAYMGKWSEGAFLSVISQEALIIISIISTILITILLLKVDFSKVMKKILRRKTDTV
jgi:membrane protein YqaA with SNARE-associated domain